MKNEEGEASEVRIGREFEPVRCLVGRLAPGDDVLQTLEDFLREEDIRMGQITLLGALQRGALGYYDQNTRKYQTITLDEHLEIASGVGNVSLREGKPALHVHLVLSDRQGHCYGGHLVAGNVVFACEFCVFHLDGKPLSRSFDEYTGLTLWRE